jgi:hypothetical protein
MSDIYKKLPKELKFIVDMYLHQLKFREIILSINWMSHCVNCDHKFVNESEMLFTNKYKEELGKTKWLFNIKYICCYDSISDF